nr:hypothetical protein [Tanacetum cinerariifolium]
LPAWHFKEVVGVGRGCFAVQRYGRRGGKKLRLIWAGKAVHSQVAEGADEVHVEDVPAASVDNEGAASVADDVVPTTVEEPSIPSPTPPTPPPQPSQT